MLTYMHTYRAASTQFKLLHPVPNKVNHYLSLYRIQRFSDHLLAKWVIDGRSQGRAGLSIPADYLDDEMLARRKGIVQRSIRVPGSPSILKGSIVKKVVSSSSETLTVGSKSTSEPYGKSSHRLSHRRESGDRLITDQIQMSPTSASVVSDSPSSSSPVVLSQRSSSSSLQANARRVVQERNEKVLAFQHYPILCLHIKLYLKIDISRRMLLWAKLDCTRFRCNNSSIILSQIKRDRIDFRGNEITMKRVLKRYRLCLISVLPPQIDY